MAFVITRLCTRAGNCVEVCPVSCIVPGPKDNPGWPYYYIDADTCINCGACQAVCPAQAIFPSEETVPDQYKEDIELNRRFYKEGPGYWKFDLEKERVHQK